MFVQKYLERMPFGFLSGTRQSGSDDEFTADHLFSQWGMPTGIQCFLNNNGGLWREIGISEKTRIREWNLVSVRFKSNLPNWSHALSNDIALNVGWKTECLSLDNKYPFGFSYIWQFTDTVLLKTFKIIP